MNEEKISSRQVVMIVAGEFFGSYIISNIISLSGPDVWFALIVEFSEAFLLAVITSAIAMVMPGRSLTAVLMNCFGTVAGKAVAVIYLLYTVYLAAAVLSSISGYSNTVSYPETPVLFMSICYMAVVAFVIKLGLEVLGRISEILVVIFVVTALVSLFSLITDFHPEFFLPVFQHGITRPVTAGLQAGVLPFGEVLYALNILPNLNDRKKTFRSLGYAVLVSALVFSLLTIRNLSVLGIDLASRNVYPSEKVFRLMPNVDIIPLLDINVIISGIIKVSFALYSQVKIFGDLFGLKDFKLFVLPFAVLDIAVSASLFRSQLQQFYFANRILPFVYLAIFVLLPVIILAVLLVKKDAKAGSPLKLE